MSSIFDSVIEGIKLSEKLLGLAESGEWEQFLELEAQRQSTLSVLKLDNIDLNEAQYIRIREKMAQLIDLNGQLETVCQQQRAFLVTALQKLSKGSEAKKAYSS